MLSVVMPVYNAELFLAEAAASVLRSSEVAELVIVDDGSTDGTPGIPSAFGERVRYERQSNRGPAAARNRGLEMARGDVVAFLDADDIWADTHPARALSELQQSGADLVFGETQCMVGSEAFGPPFHTFQLGSAVCRREVFERAGTFDERMRFGEDVDWFLRVRDSGAAIVALPELSLFYRLHEGNRDRIHQTSRAGLLDALHQSLQRRRSR